MKCIKKNGEVKRVSNELAWELVNNGDWEYCPKSEWKEQERKEK